jgi:prolipoprotein diacylglyceryltransferase
MDMIVIVTALAGASIRFGNLMNSEIYGKPTGTNNGFIFTNDLTKVLNNKYKGSIDHISYERIADQQFENKEGVPIQINIEFARKIKDVQKAEQMGDFMLGEDLSRYNYDHNVFLPDSINYKVERRDKRIWLTATIGGLPRYPTQIYEAFSYLLIFLLLLGIFYGLDQRLRNGFIFGVFLLLLFSARFFIEYIKENQETFEDTMSLNMGQILSIPFILAGICLIILKWPKKAVEV